MNPLRLRIGLWFGLPLLAVLGGPLTPARASSLSPKTKTLLKQKRRPTPPELRESYGGEVALKNPFDSQGKRDYGDFIHRVHTVMPKAIAQFEKVFPGAIYASLGRDAVIMSDVLDAYYTSIGQPGRVARVDLSTDSFSDSEGNDVKGERIVRFLKGNTPIAFKDPKQIPGFVVFDRTSYSESSQSRKLMTAIYNEFAKQGFDTKELAKKVNIVAVAPDNKFSPSGAGERLTSYFAAERKGQKKKPGSPPRRALSLAGITDGDEWHDTWSEIKRSGRKLYTEPTAKGDLDSHGEILGQMHEVLKIVESAEFRRAVEKASASLGIKAPHQRGAKAAAIEADTVAKEAEVTKALREFRESLSAMKASLQPAGNRSAGREELSPNGKKMLAWLTKSLTLKRDLASVSPQRADRSDNHVIAPFFTAITNAREGELISDADYKELIARGLSGSTMDDAMKNRLADLWKKSARFKSALRRHQGYFRSVSNDAERPSTQMTWSAYASLMRQIEPEKKLSY